MVPHATVQRRRAGFRSAMLATSSALSFLVAHVLRAILPLGDADHHVAVLQRATDDLDHLVGVKDPAEVVAHAQLKPEHSCLHHFASGSGAASSTDINSHAPRPSDRRT